MDYHLVFEDAAIKNKIVEVKTKARGTIVGIPLYLDEFIADEDKLGYCLNIGKNQIDVVFFDEIVAIVSSAGNRTTDMQNIA